MPKVAAISRCFSFLSFRILKTWTPICARAKSSSESFSPRSAKMLPELSSNSIGFLFFVLMGQLHCLGVSLLDEINIPLRSFNASLRLLLKGMQNVNSLAELHGQRDSI